MKTSFMNQVGNMFRAITTARSLIELEQRVGEQIDRLELLIDRIEQLQQQPRPSYTPNTPPITTTNNASFIGFMVEVIRQLRTNERVRTAEAYQSALSSFRKFNEDKDILFRDINDLMIQQYEVYLWHRGVSKNSSSFYMRILRAVYNRAIDQNLIGQSNPFKHVYTGVDKTIKRAISMTAIRRLKDLDLSHDPKADFARDMFLFSFYTRGMSYVDMVNLKRSNLSKGYIIYRRRKTGQVLHIKWEPCMQAIVDKYQHQCTDGYLLPIMRESNQPQQQCKYMQNVINQHLRHAARFANISTTLTLYVARHSWASIARSKHIPLSIISESMGHDSEKTTRIYLTSLDKSAIDNANKQILKEL